MRKNPIDEINNCLKLWCMKNFGEKKSPNFVYIEGNGNFFYSYRDKTIFWGLYQQKIPADEFILHVLHQDAPDFSPFIYFIFHELGHFFTFTEEDFNNFSDDQNQTAESNFPTREEMLKHFNKPFEKKATDWAITFLKDNTREVKELEQAIKPWMEQAYSMYRTLM